MKYKVRFEELLEETLGYINIHGLFISQLVSLIKLRCLLYTYGMHVATLEDQRMQGYGQLRGHQEGMER